MEAITLEDSSTVRSILVRRIINGGPYRIVIPAEADSRTGDPCQDAINDVVEWITAEDSYTSSEMMRVEEAGYRSLGSAICQEDLEFGGVLNFNASSRSE